MRKNKDRTDAKLDEATGLVRFADAFEALYPPEIAAVKRMRAHMLRSLRQVVEPWQGTQKEKATRLGIAQPRFALLMKKHAPEDRFTLDNLVALTVKAGLTAKVDFIATNPTIAAVSTTVRAAAKAKPAVKKARTSHRVTAHV